MPRKEKKCEGKITPQANRPDNWDGFFDALKDGDVPDDFLSKEEQPPSGRDRVPFESWQKTRNNLPLLLVNDGTPVTMELNNQLRDELP